MLNRREKEINGVWYVAYRGPVHNPFIRCARCGLKSRICSTRYSEKDQRNVATNETIHDDSACGSRRITYSFRA